MKPKSPRCQSWWRGDDQAENQALVRPSGQFRPSMSRLKLLRRVFLGSPADKKFPFPAHSRADCLKHHLSSSGGDFKWQTRIVFRQSGTLLDCPTSLKQLGADKTLWQPLWRVSNIPRCVVPQEPYWGIAMGLREDASRARISGLDPPERIRRNFRGNCPKCASRLNSGPNGKFVFT